MPERTNTCSPIIIVIRYEPEVLAFVQKHGGALGIDPERPCTEEQAKWEDIAKDARLSSSAPE